MEEQPRQSALSKLCPPLPKLKLVCLSSLASGTHATNIGCHPQQLPLPLKYPQLPLSQEDMPFCFSAQF